MGQIALLSSIASFILAGMASVLSVLGLFHFRRVPVTEEIPRFVVAEQVAATTGNVPRGAAVPS
jgi:hypothetical protein